MQKLIALESIARHIFSNDWATLLFIGVFALLAFVKNRYNERFLDFCNLLFSNKYFTSHEKSPKVFNFFSFLLFMVNALIISMGLLILFKAFNMTATTAPVLLFFQAFIMYNILIGAKYLIEKIIGNLFSIERILDNYIFYKITYKNFLSLLLLPVIVFFMYTVHPSKNTLMISLSIFLLAHVLGLVNYFRKNEKLLFKHWFYFILYLCTLEIAPYFILYKVFTHAN